MQLPQLVHKLYSDGLFARPSFAAPELLAPLKFEKAAAAEQNVAVSQVAAIKRKPFTKEQRCDEELQLLTRLLAKAPRTFGRAVLCRAVLFVECFELINAHGDT